jgi:hypothetical protein
MNKLYRILPLFIILLNACACPIKSAPLKSEMPSNIPNVAALEMRVKQLYEAESKRDFRTWYNLSTLSLKVVPKDYPKERSCSYEEFEKEFTRQRDDKFKILSWNINKITLREKPNQITIIVAVEMDVVTQEMSKEPIRSKDQTDYWMYIDNTWYWTWRGWPID